MLLCCSPLLCVHSLNKSFCSNFVFIFKQLCQIVSYLLINTKQKYIHICTHRAAQSNKVHIYKHNIRMCVSACPVVHTPLTFCSNQQWARKIADHMSNRIITFCNYMTVLRQSSVTCGVARSGS